MAKRWSGARKLCSAQSGEGKKKSKLREASEKCGLAGAEVRGREPGSKNRFLRIGPDSFGWLRSAKRCRKMMSFYSGLLRIARDYSGSAGLVTFAYVWLPQAT